MTFIGLEDSVVISRMERHIVPCVNCELIESEHDGRASSCEDFYPDVEVAEERYVEENEWMLMGSVVTAAGVAEIIKIPVDQWEGSCTAIAESMLREGMVPGAVGVHGVWLGPISNRSKTFAGQPFSQHHWIVNGDDSIIDPTRWCFEGLPPYIWHGFDEDDYYDEGANQLNAEISIRPPFPAEVEDDAAVLDFGEDEGIVFAITGSDTLLYDHARAMWLGNQSYDKFKGQAKAIYGVLEAAGFGACIPWDNLNRAAQGR